MTTPFLRRVQVIIFTLTLCGALLLAACSSNQSTTGGSHSKNPHSTSGSQSPSGSSQINGVLFGGSASLVAQEGKLGRKVALIRTYYGIGPNGITWKANPSNFPSSQDAQFMAGGRTLLVSFGSSQWADIAAGKLDSAFTSALSKVNQAAITYHLNAIYVCFEHEVDLKVGKSTGTAQQFVAAWRHIHQLAANQHLNWQQGGKLHWVLIYDQAAFPKKADSLWPGQDTVDILGDDTYQQDNCYTMPNSTNLIATGKSVTPAQLVSPVLTWAAKNAPGIPVFIPEWGTVPFQDTAVRPTFIQEMNRFIDNHPEIQGEMYWDEHGKGGCDYSIDNEPASLSALATMGKDPHFQAQP